MDEIVCLVSREGKRFPIQEQVLKSSSDFFKATLETNMQEAGKFCSAKALVFFFCSTGREVHEFSGWSMPLSRLNCRNTLV